jgi:hypothetical protein
MEEVVSQRPCGVCGSTDLFPCGDCRPCGKRRAAEAANRPPTPEMLATPCRRCGEVNRDAKDRARCITCRQRRTNVLYAQLKKTDPEAVYRRNRSSQLRTDFNISLEHYEMMLNAQGGVCAICGQPETALDQNSEVKALAVDHDKRCCPGRTSCGACIRGLLCLYCNHGLGRFRDNPVLLAAAIRYLA